MDRFDSTGPSRPSKSVLASRIRSIREEIYGEHGVPEIAEKLGLPLDTWRDFERGATIPGEILLCYLELTGADPLWLLTGVGAKFRAFTHEEWIDARRE